MPELPEVETVRRQLDAGLRGKTIKEVRILQSGREEPVGDLFAKKISGRVIRGVRRRAKLLIWDLGDDLFMLSHLKMTGRFVFNGKDYVPGKHDRIIFEFTEKNAKCQMPNAKFGCDDLIWADVRKFGFLKLVDRQGLEKAVSGYGPEPLESSAQELAERLQSKSVRKIKTFLLDQSVIAGVGNIYADEALFEAGVRPTRRVASLKSSERLLIAKAIQKVLSSSLEHGGTTANDYVDTSGERGKFFEKLKVYGRAGEKCKRCGETIKRVVIGQRSACYCGSCQR